MKIENAVVIVNKTRLELLIERFNTKAQARFYVEHAGGDFSDYESEHDVFHRSLYTVVENIQERIKLKVVERKFLPNFLFSGKDLVVVVGQEGLVANTAKYVAGLPILAVNPDPTRNDGKLLPYRTDNFADGFEDVLKDRFSYQLVTMAEATTNDGQRLLAFNDFFVGPASHTSARYRIIYGKKSEDQSSSGIIVSTGAGSTGWLSSMFNMTNGIQSMVRSSQNGKVSFSLPWNTHELAFVVRDRFSADTRVLILLPAASRVPISWW